MKHKVNILFFRTTESESGSDEDEDGRHGRLIDDSAEPGPVGSTEGDGIHMTPAEAREARGSGYLRDANILKKNNKTHFVLKM